MTVTLDKVFVPACLQMLGSVSGVLHKAQAHAEKHGISEQELLEARLINTMWPLLRQIQALWTHSIYAIEEAKAGAFHPSVKGTPTTWDEMVSFIAKIKSDLNALEEGELDAIADQSVYFMFGEERRFKFTAQNFLLSFSLPNIHFHTATAFGILRMKGVDIGKFDFLGNMRMDPQ